MNVSVVIIARNAAQTIRQCLESVSHQTVSPREIIVVDGRSSDSTREVAAQYGCNVLVTPRRDTYGEARNLGSKVASGDVIAFLDADDTADSHWLQNVALAFADPSAGIATARRRYVYPRNWFTAIKWNRSRSSSPDEPRDYDTMSWDYFRTISGAVRKSVLEAVGYFDEDMFFGTEDKDLAFRAYRLGWRVTLIQGAIVYHRPASFSREWLLDSFYRHGMGHGNMRRKYGVYRPPLWAPTSLLLAISGLLASIGYGSATLLFAPLIPLLGSISIHFLRAFTATSKFLPAIAYSLLTLVGRTVEMIGFALGYSFSAKTLRRLWRR